jgi:hypothetical protein
MSVTNTIKPAGGGDYTTLQAWEDAVDGLGANTYIGECDDSGNLGAVTFAGITATSILRAVSTVPHNGSLSAGAYIESTAVCVTINAPTVEIFGLRIKKTSATTNIVGVATPSGDVTGFIIDGCLIESDLASGSTPAAINVGSSGSRTASGRISNNITICTNAGATAANAAIAIGATQTGDLTNTTTVLVYNNTIIGKEKILRGIIANRNQLIGTGTANLTLTARNNVVIGATTADYATTANSGTGTLTITSSNNASEDSTADWAGGSGHVEDIVPADEFTNPASDWSLKSTSNLVGAGFDLSGTFTNDAYGNTRTVPFNIGAWEGVASAAGNPWYYYSQQAIAG